jgi:hypothetical protein
MFTYYVNLCHVNVIKMTLCSLIGTRCIQENESSQPRRTQSASSLLQESQIPTFLMSHACNSTYRHAVITGYAVFMSASSSFTQTLCQLFRSQFTTIVCKTGLWSWITRFIWFGGKRPLRDERGPQSIDSPSCWQQKKTYFWKFKDTVANIS